MTLKQTDSSLIDERMLYRILTLYYMEEANQADIARTMGLSTAKVNRLLKQAKEQGLVEISIRMPSQHLFDLERQLRGLSSLHEAVIVPKASDNADVVLQQVGRAAADYLLQNLNDGDTIAISGGKTMNAIVQQIETSRTYNVQVVPATGARQGHYYTDVNNLAAQLAQKLGGTAYQMHAPVLVDSHAERDVLLSLRQINDVLDIARSAQIALFSVGSVIPNVSSYFDLMTQTVDPAEWERLLVEAGASGEVLAYLYDRDGALCLPSFNSRVIGLSLDELRAIPTTIAVAATPEKALPIYSALKGNTMQRLVTDEATATAVLDLYAEGDRTVTVRQQTSA